MKYLNKKTGWLFLLLIISFLPAFSQNALTMLKFEDAEKAFNAGNYEQALKHLNDVEKKAGITSKTLYLRIVAENKIFDNGSHLYEDKSGFIRLQRIRQNAAKYLKALSKQGVDDKYREIYRISESLDAFPKAIQAWQAGYDSVLKHKARVALLVANCRFDYADYFSEGLAIVVQNGMYGAIDKQGQLTIPFKFNELRGFKGGLAAAKTGSKWGFINKSGEWVIQPEYDTVGVFSEGLAAVHKHRRPNTFYLDRNGNHILSALYPNMYPFSNGLSLFKKKNGKFGYFSKETGIGKAAEMAIRAKYEDASSFLDGMALVNDKTFIDTTGNILFSVPQYDAVSLFHEGFAIVYKDKKFGFIDKSGREVIPLKFDRVGPFFEGMARVKIGDKWGFIDTQGRHVISPQYDAVGRFNENTAAVVLGDKRGIIDKSGKMIIPPEYESASAFIEGFAQVKFHGKWGFIDKYNRILKIKLK